MTDMDKYPLLAEADVVVCGGGTAGVFAAVAAAEQGADVLLLEQAGCVGGTAVGGLVTPMMSLRLPEDVRCSYIANRLDPDRYADPVVLGWEQEKMCLAAGVRLLYHVTVCSASAHDGRIGEITVACKGGLHRIRGKVFIDATGDADLCCYAGAEWEQGSPETGANQPMSLRYLVGGVDLERLGAFLDNMGRNQGPAHTARAGNRYYEIYAAVMTDGDWALKELFRQGIAGGRLKEEDMAYWQLFGVPGRKDTLSLNNPEFFDLTDSLDPRQLTQVQIRGREAIFRQLEFYRKHFPGCEEAYVAQIAPMVGVRESRRVRTSYMLTALDLATHRKFPDRIAQSNYPVDIHGLPLDALQKAAESEKPWFEVPYRCLVVEGLENLLVAGRCVGADFVAQSALRIQLTCRSLGEAAGLAAAMAAKEDGNVTRISGVEVGAAMETLGAEFLE